MTKLKEQKELATENLEVKEFKYSVWYGALDMGESRCGGYKFDTLEETIKHDQEQWIKEYGMQNER